jgi:hypothetical protein
MLPVTSVFVPDTIDRLAQRQQNQQVKLALTVRTGVLLGALVMKEVKNLLRDDSRGRLLR